MRDGWNGLFGGRLRGFDGSGLHDGSAVMEKARAEENCREHDDRDDSERKIVEIGQRRQQGRPLKVRLSEFVARPVGGAFDRYGLRMDLWL